MFRENMTQTIYRSKPTAHSLSLAKGMHTPMLPGYGNKENDFLGAYFWEVGKHVFS